MAAVKLFSTEFSPFGQRVQIALLEKGIPFEFVLVDLFDKPQELLDANPIHKKVPTLVHDGKAVSESMVILEYLEDAWPEQVPLLPKEAFERSQVRFWADYIVNLAYPSSFFAAMRAEPGSPERLAAIELGAKVFGTLEDAMLSFSSDGPFFTGAAFGYLDVVLAPLTTFDVVLEKLSGISIPGADANPRLYRWIEAMKERPSVKTSLLESEENYATLSALFQKRASMAAAAKGK